MLYLRGIISRKTPWDVMPDLYFYREPEEIEKEEQAAAAAQAKPEETAVYQQDWAPAPIEQGGTGEWTEAAVPGATAGDVSFIVFNYLLSVQYTLKSQL